jgi:hypothetical protein
MALTFRRKAYGFPESELENSIFAFKRYIAGMQSPPAIHKGAAALHPHASPRMKHAAVWDKSEPVRTRESQSLVRHALQNVKTPSPHSEWNNEI